MAERTKRNTLLSKIFGDKYAYASDIPPIINEHGEFHPKVKDFAHRLMTEDNPNVQAPGLGLLEQVSLSPLGSTKSFVKVLKSAFKMTPKQWKNMLTLYGKTIKSSALNSPNLFTKVRIDPVVRGAEGMPSVKISYQQLFPNDLYRGYRGVLGESRLRFDYDTILKRINAVGLRSTENFAGKRLTHKILNDVFDSLPKGTTINPHPMNEQSLPVFVKYVENNPNKIQLYKNLTDPKRLVTFPSESKADLFVKKYQGLGARKATPQEEMNDVFGEMEAFLISEQVRKGKWIPKSVVYPDFLLKKIK